MKYAPAWDELKEWIDIALETYPDEDRLVLGDVRDKIDRLEEEYE